MYYVKELTQTDSTNKYAMRNIADFADKTVIIAQKQTDGHGRFDRKWLSDNPQNLYMSIILKPCDTFNENLPLSNLTQYLSVAIVKTLERYGVEASIKWPNDVLVDKKKISGILAEASAQGNKLNGIVLGAGINLNMTEDEIKTVDQRATSLNLETNREIDKKEFTQNLLEIFFREYDDFLVEGFEHIKHDYISKCFFIGKEITIKNLDEITKGIAKKINEDGSLTLKTDYEETIVRIGDVIC